MLVRGLVVAGALLLAVPVAADAAPIAGPGADISYPQCGWAYPAGASFGFVGVNGGTFADYNPCLASELSWAGALPRAPQLYIVAANPGPGGTFWNMGGQRPCDGSDSAGCAFDYGEIGAQRAVAQAAPSLTGPVFWWVDVEKVNTFSGDTGLNNAEVAGELQGLRESGQQVSGEGIYTHAPSAGPSELVSLLGDVSDFASYPLWLATGSGDAGQAAAACGVKSDTGGPVVYGQALVGGFDADVACPPEVAGVAGPLTATTRVSGSGLPGTTVSIAVRTLSGTLLTTETAAVGSGGTWRATVPFTRDARITVTGDSGTGFADLRPSVVVTLSSRVRAAGSCAATVTGTTNSWWKGQTVVVKGGAASKTVTTKRSSRGGSFSAVVSGLCGRARTITATADGKSGRQRLTEPGTSRRVVAKLK